MIAEQLRNAAGASWKLGQLLEGYHGMIGNSVALLQNTEDRSQKTEVRRQKSENRTQNSKLKTQNANFQIPHSKFPWRSDCQMLSGEIHVAKPRRDDCDKPSAKDVGETIFCCSMK